MKNSKYIVIILGMLIMLGSCIKPEQPTEVQILTGEWEVVNVIANGQVNFPDDVFLENSILHLDRNASFLFINVDGRAEAGTWTADSQKLTLTTESGAKVYTLVYRDFEKLQVVYNFTNDITGDIELRYLFNRVN